MENSRINSEITRFPASFTSTSAEETFALGERFAATLGKGSIVALKGPLGAGKTCFVQGVAWGLGVVEPITSPTYTIVSEYTAPTASPTSLYHIDAYRLRGGDDFSAIGGEEILFSDGISLIEWSERIEDFIPAGALVIEIEILKDGKRLISIHNKGKAKGAAIEYSGA